MSYTDLFLDFGLTWGTIALLLLILAWRDAVNGNHRRHGILMTIQIIGAWVFVVSYLARYFIPGSEPQIPDHLIPWIMFHGTVALIPFIGGTLMVWARLSKNPSSKLLKKFNANHRRYGKVIVPTWAFTHLGGIANYWIIGA